MRLRDTAGDRALFVDGISIRFGGVQALADVSFHAIRGKVTALIGPNGAGKTTMFNIVSGEIAPQEGTVRFEGTDITGWEPHRICAGGMARTFQNPRLFRNLGCVENVLAARYGRTKATLVESVIGAPRARAEARSDRERAMTLLRQVGLEAYCGRMPGNLSYGNQRRLEIARALATEPRFLLMDEPTAGMAAHAIDDLLDLIRSLAESGLTVLLIEHNMSVVTSISSHVVVLDHGRKIAQGLPAQVLRDPAVIEAYVGADE